VGVGLQGIALLEPDLSMQTLVHLAGVHFFFDIPCGKKITETSTPKQHRFPPKKKNILYPFLRLQTKASFKFHLFFVCAKNNCGGVLVFHAT